CMTTLVPRHPWTLAISDTAVMTRRYLYHYLRKPSLLGIALVQPVLFVLLWTYVFSGAIQTPGGITYVDYLMPGLFILAIAFGSANTGVGLADDLARGLIARFRGPPPPAGRPDPGRSRPQHLRGAADGRGRLRRGLPLPRRPGRRAGRPRPAPGRRLPVVVDLGPARPDGAD